MYPGCVNIKLQRENIYIFISGVSFRAEARVVSSIKIRPQQKNVRLDLHLEIIWEVGSLKDHAILLICIFSFIKILYNATNHFTIHNFTVEIVILTCRHPISLYVCMYVM